MQNRVLFLRRLQGPLPFLGGHCPASLHSPFSLLACWVQVVSQDKRPVSKRKAERPLERREHEHPGRRGLNA